MRKLITAITITAVMISLTSASAYAGSSKKHTVEGIVLGTIIGATIVSAFDNDRTVYVNNTYRVRENRRGYGGWDRNDSGFSNHYPRNKYPQNRYRDDWNHHERYRYNHHDGYRNHNRNRGHWVERKVWVEPSYKRIWIESHRDGYRGPWISGHYETRMVREGYYRTDREWVSRY